MNKRWGKSSIYDDSVKALTSVYNGKWHKSIQGHHIGVFVKQHLPLLVETLCFCLERSYRCTFKLVGSQAVMEKESLPGIDTSAHPVIDLLIESRQDASGTEKICPFKFQQYIASDWIAGMVTVRVKWNLWPRPAIFQSCDSRSLVTGSRPSPYLRWICLCL